MSVSANDFQLCCESALSWQELEYPDGHTSRSIYVAMPITSLPKGLSDDLKQQLQGAALAIWTTTPWTIPANAAVAVNADLKYCVAQSQVTVLALPPALSF